MIAASERTLRRSAWGVWWLLVLSTAVAVPLSFLDGNSGGSWGSGGIAGEVAFVGVWMSFPFVGLLILRLQPRNAIGWLLIAVGMVAGLGLAADSYAVYGLLVSPGSVPGPAVVAAVNEASWAPWIGLMGTFLILLYPDGHLPSPRWRPVAWLSAVTILIVTVTILFSPGSMQEGPVPTMENPIGSQAAEPLLKVLLAIFLPLLPLCIVACAVALVRRFRRSHGIERQQLKWLATAGAGVAFVYLLMMVSVFLKDTNLISADATGWVTALQTLSVLSFVLLPLAIGVAILRHNLYGIDVIINRAIVYGFLTATLATVYLGSVLLLQLALSPLTKQSDLAVAGSTLAAAALFRPVRARIRHIVDRRFYRSRYDATRTLDDFAVRLRHELDLDAVGTDLRAAVHETVQPALVSLWLRP